MRGPLVSALTATFMLGLTVLAQDDEGPSVKSTVVVDDRVVVSSNGPAQSSGLTLSPLVETPADAVRRDAEDLYSAGRLRPLNQPVQPVETVVQVDGVVATEKRGGHANACVQVGVVGARAKCRPGKQ